MNDVAPDVAVQFQQGKFAVSKTSKPFLAIPIDQAHEQNNAPVKGEGGAVGLTSALRRWMVSGPEIARIINEFEARPRLLERWLTLNQWLNPITNG